MSACPGSHTYPGYFTLPNGCPVENPLKNEMVATEAGNGRSQLLQDINIVDQISHITRERIPERFVHAKGTGVKGHFEVDFDTSPNTFDPSEYSHAKFLQKGMKTDLFARFSTVTGERGSADSVRDTRGFAFKLYTTEGNLDWVFFNPAVFPIRDPGKFTSNVHATKRDPASNLRDPLMFWDYFNNHYEGYNLLMRIFSDEGTPKAYTNCEVHSVNTYTFVKNDGPTPTVTYIKVKLVPDQARENFNINEATSMAGADPDYLSRVLWKDIASGKTLSWTVKAQLFQLDPNSGVMVDPIHPQSDSHRISDINVFDPTRTVPEDLFPFRKFGKIFLDGNPKNAFAEVEQAAFSPANVVPGWDISPDPILQIRLFAYGDTQRYRLGPNADQLPTNRVKNAPVWDPIRRDGVGMYTDNYGPTPNYIGTPPTVASVPHTNVSSLNWTGRALSYVSMPSIADYDQPRNFWIYLRNPSSTAEPATLPDGLAAQLAGVNNWHDFSVAQKNFVYNVASDLYGARCGTDESIWSRAFDHFRSINENLGTAVETATRFLYNMRRPSAFSDTMTCRETGPVPSPVPGVPATDQVFPILTENGPARI